MSTLYTEDIKAINSVAEKTNLSVAANVFRLTKNQTDALNDKRLRAHISINAPSVKKSGRPTIMTPRMTEAAATLSYMGFKQSEIGEMFGCDYRTVSANLVKYHGWHLGGF